jgi:hypothetical protein
MFLTTHPWAMPTRCVVHLYFIYGYKILRNFKERYWHMLSLAMLCRDNPSIDPLLYIITLHKYYKITAFWKCTHCTCKVQERQLDRDNFIWRRSRLEHQLKHGRLLLPFIAAVLWSCRSTIVKSGC